MRGMDVGLLVLNAVDGTQEQPDCGQSPTPSVARCTSNRTGNPTPSKRAPLGGEINCPLPYHREEVWHPPKNFWQAGGHGQHETTEVYIRIVNKGW